MVCYHMYQATFSDFDISQYGSLYGVTLEADQLGKAAHCWSIPMLSLWFWFPFKLLLEDAHIESMYMKPGVTLEAGTGWSANDQLGKAAQCWSATGRYPSSRPNPPTPSCPFFFQLLSLHSDIPKAYTPISPETFWLRYPHLPTASCHQSYPSPKVLRLSNSLFPQQCFAAVTIMDIRAKFKETVSVSW